MKKYFSLFVLAAVAAVTLELLIVLRKPAVKFEEAAVSVPAREEAPLAAAPRDIPAERVSAAAEPKLELELMGTLTSGRFAVAFIKDSVSGLRGSYKVGSVVQGARVVRIEKGKAVLECNGGKLVLAMSSRAGNSAGIPADASCVETVSPGTMVVRTAVLAREQGEILKELGKVRLKPSYRGRTAAGLRIEGIEAGGIMTSAGLRNDDVIREVNAQTVDSYQKALQVLVKARRQREIKVNLEREGMMKQLSYRLE